MGVAQVLDIKQTKEGIATLKQLYIEYYRDVPVKRFAAQFIGKDEETVRAWTENDPEFKAQVSEAESQNVKKIIPKTKPEWRLERTFPDVFGEKKQDQNINILVQPILGGTLVHGNNSDHKVIEVKQEDTSSLPEQPLEVENLIED